jgi:hypothetical protein
LQKRIYSEVETFGKQQNSKISGKRMKCKDGSFAGRKEGGLWELINPKENKSKKQERYIKQIVRKG